MSINSIDNEILVTVNGVVMKKNEDYTIENGNLTFKIAPEINDSNNRACQRALRIRIGFLWNEAFIAGFPGN